jgi:hypothetical protein
MNQGGEFFYAMALLLFFCCFITGAVRRWLKMPTAAKIMQLFFLHAAPTELCCLTLKFFC